MNLALLFHTHRARSNNGVHARHRRDLYDEAVAYFKHGAGNGAIKHVVWKLYPDGLGQAQESGRDQGHSMLDITLHGSFCQMAWNQGDDLFGYDDNRFLHGAKYVAQYNLGKPVPYTAYVNSDVMQASISDSARGNVRPIWALIYNHHAVLKGLPALSVKVFVEQVVPEGGGGDYGPNSGGFDQLGYGTGRAHDLVHLKSPPINYDSSRGATVVGDRRCLPTS